MRLLSLIAFRARSIPFVALAMLSASSTLTAQLAQRAAKVPAPAAALASAPAATGTVVVRVTADSTPIAGAMIASGTTNGATDRSGQATFMLPTGRRTFRVTSNGYFPDTVALNVVGGMTKVTVMLRRQVALPEGIVAARRDVRRGADEPTNVEATDRDALDEQVEQSPGTITDLISRVDGVRVQQLSAGSAGSAIRIRGMPGRYTKFLIDGLPLFGASPEGQAISQIPAFGVQRVEVIKGVSSALYGPTALGGIVNVVSAAPTSPSEIVVNGSTHEASDVAIWQTHTFAPRWSASLVAGRSAQSAGDTDGDGWAEVNGYRRIVVRPRVYWSRSDRSSWFMTGGWTSEHRQSGTFNGARLPDFNMYNNDADTRHGDVGTVGRVLQDTNMILKNRASM